MHASHRSHKFLHGGKSLVFTIFTVRPAHDHPVLRITLLRSGLALKARNFSGSLTGISALQFDASSINVDINQASGADTVASVVYDARVLNWTADIKEGG